MGNDKKNILIIGVDSDMGRILAEQALDQNFDVYGTGRKKTPEDLTDITVHEHFTYIPLDILVSDSTKAFWRVVNSMDRLDWVAYFPGHISTNEREQLSESTYIQDAFSINVGFAMQLVSTLCDRITNRGGVFFISSTAALSPNGGFPIYSASKAALNAFAASLKLYWADIQKGSAIFTICPGPTNTRMREAVAADAELKQSPEIISSCMLEIMNNKSNFKSGDVIVIEDGTVRSWA